MMKTILPANSIASVPSPPKKNISVDYNMQLSNNLNYETSTIQKNNLPSGTQKEAKV